MNLKVGKNNIISFKNNKDYEEFLLNTYQKHFPSSNKMYFEKKSKQTIIWKLSSKNKVKEFLHWLYNNSKIHLNRKYKIYLKSRGHVKLG